MRRQLHILSPGKYDGCYQLVRGEFWARWVGLRGLAAQYGAKRLTKHRLTASRILPNVFYGLSTIEPKVVGFTLNSTWSLAVIISLAASFLPLLCNVTYL